MSLQLNDVFGRYNFEKRKINIAQRPVEPRDHSKLLIYDRRSSKIIDDYFYNLNNYLPADSCLIINNSKVEKCRLVYGNIELFILKRLSKNQCLALVKPGKKFQIGSTIEIFPGIECLVQDIDEHGARKLQFNVDLSTIDDQLLTPLPPYIDQDESLHQSYQTTYAKNKGSLPAPTAGFHFTPQLLNQISYNHQILEVTLHVGVGTFATLRQENFDQNKLHEEFFQIDQSVCQAIIEAKSRVMVGTTSTRTIESVSRELQWMKNERQYRTISNSTQIFIQPGYKFLLTDSLITNFHLPGTSLLLLVEAFLGSKDQLELIYNHAIDNNYRFYSFGDAMLIL